MDVRILWTLVILTTFSAIIHANNYNDTAIVLTALPFTRDGFKHIVSIPTTPIQIPEYTGKYNGFKFDSINHEFLACAVDYEWNHLYLYDYDSRKLLLGENFNSSAIKSEIPFSDQHFGIGKEYVKIVVDWVSHNVYWTDPVMGWIAIQPGGAINDTTLYTVIVTEHLDLPRGLAIDPLDGYLFWALNGKQPMIERSDLTGNNRVQLITNNLQIPAAIVADHTSKRIYWTDWDSIDSSTYDGTDRRHLVRYSYATFLDIALFENVIMATDINEYYLYFYDKVSGAKVVDKVGSATEGYFGLCVYDRSTQPPAPIDRCKNAGCQDICVNEPTKATCLCKTGFVLNTDGKSCSEAGGQHHRAIIVSTMKDLCVVDIRILSDHHDFTPECFYIGPENETITSLDINMATREVYFSEGRNIYSVPIDGGAHNRKTLATPPHDVTGLTYDWVNNHIYYAQDGTDSKSIWILNPTTGETLVRQTKTSDSPRNLVVVPHEGRVYWIAGENKIEYTNLNVLGSDIKEIDLTYNFSNPVHMYHDVKYEMLYVLDDLTFSQEIVEIFYNGSYSDFIQVDNTVIDFVLYKDYILLTQHSANGVILKSADIRLGTPIQAMESGKLKGIDDVYNIKVLDKDFLQPLYPSPCGTTLDNGGCEDICIPSGSTSKCACKLGFTLDTTGKKCTAKAVANEFILATDITYNEIYQISLTDPTKVIGIRTPNLGLPNGVLYNYKTNKMIYASRSEREIWSIHLDGSNDTLISRTGYYLYATPDRLALDPSTGNIYYTALSESRDDLEDSFIGIIDPQGNDNILIWEGHSPADIVLHPQLGYMFWSDRGAAHAIYRANMDGSGRIKIVEDGLVWPNGLAIDFDESRLYFVDSFLNKIFYCNFNGSQQVMFLEVPGATLMDLSLMGNYLYYTAWDLTHITKVNKNSPNDTSNIGPPAGLGSLHAIDLYSSTAKGVPVNTGCANKNGGCSHFCLPTPDGNTCGCDWRNELLSDGKNCENAPRCSYFIPGGMVDEETTCLRLVGNVCAFSCSENFKPKPGITSLTCTNQTLGINVFMKTWDILEPCEEKFCPPLPLDGVVLPISCRGGVGEDCGNFTCGPGYEKNKNVNKLICKDDETWDYSQPLCLKKCPDFTTPMEHAVLQSCNRDIGDTCNFKCVDRYMYASNVNSVTCLEGSRWNRETETLCTEIKCKDYIENGFVNETCSLLVGSVCQYHCDAGSKANPNVASISCKGQGEWDYTLISPKLQPCEILPTTSGQNQDNIVGIGVGVGIGALIIIILIVVLLVFLFRTGRLSGGHSKSTPASTTTAFENPRYVTGDNVNIQASSGREGDKGFGYATLDDETVSEAPTYESLRQPQHQAASASNRIYDNTPSVMQMQSHP